MMYRSGIKNETLLVLITVLACINFPGRGAKPFQPVNGDPMFESGSWWGRVNPVPAGI